MGEGGFKKIYTAMPYTVLGKNGEGIVPLLKKYTSKDLENENLVKCYEKPYF